MFVRWRLETLDGKPLQKGERTLRALALSDTLVGSYDFSAQVSAENQRNVVFIAELWQANSPPPASRRLSPTNISNCANPA